MLWLAWVRSGGGLADELRRRSALAAIDEAGEEEGELKCAGMVLGEKASRRGASGRYVLASRMRRSLGKSPYISQPNSNRDLLRNHQTANEA